MNEKNQKRLENLDETLKRVQAKFVGPKFRYKNFTDTEAFKEFDSKRIISTSNLKKHFIITLMLIWFPIALILGLIINEPEMTEALGPLLFVWIVTLMIWAIMWWASSKTCTHKDCKATRGKNYHLKISTSDNGIVGTFSETKTNDKGVKTTRHYANREYLELWQCACCKREFKARVISRETI